MPGPRDYTSTTRTALAALSRGTCYFPGCVRPVIVMEQGEPYVDVHIAHIHDAHVGNRHDASMSDDDRRSFANLILLCKPHHDLVDKRHPDRYSADELRQWKAEREARQMLLIDDPDVVDERHIEEALRVGALLTLRDSNLQLGGAGGAAIASGGGGGGVVGSGTGGSGGAGGSIYIGDEIKITLDGTPGTSPGSGGGGGGLLIPGTLSRHRKPGEGSEGTGCSDGFDGLDAQASSLGEPGGDVYILAAGGRGALAGEGPRLRSEALRLSMFALANSTDIRDGLVYLLGAAWQSYSTLNLGTAVTLPLILVFEAGGVDPGDYTARVSVEDPTAQTVASTSFPVTVKGAGDILRIPRVIVMEPTLTSFGIWRLRAESDAGLLGILDLMIKRTGVA